MVKASKEYVVIKLLVVTSSSGVTEIDYLNANVHACIHVGPIFMYRMHFAGTAFFLLLLLLFDTLTWAECSLHFYQLCVRPPQIKTGKSGLAMRDCSSMIARRLYFLLQLRLLPTAF